MTLPNVVYTDRSRIEKFQFCPRSRWWQYHFGGQGIVPTRLSIPLTVGTDVHEGLGILLKGGDIEDAVQVATDLYWKEVRKRGLQAESGDDEDIVAKEQAALVEGMLRGYAKVQLPKLLEEYEVLEVEQEDLMLLDKGKDGEPDIILMARADALLLHKQDGDLYIQSFKTAASWDMRTDRNAQFDMQGLSEIAAVEDRLKRHWEILQVGRGDYKDIPSAMSIVGVSPRMEEWLRGQPSPPRIMGVRYEYLLKGDRYKDEKSGRWLSHSPLIRGYIRHGVTVADSDFAWKSRMPCPGAGQHEVKGKPCPGQQYHTLGKDYVLFNVWDGTNVSGGVKAWIDLLMTGTVQPELIEQGTHPIESQFIVPQPYFRDAIDVEEWKVTAAYQERKAARALAQIEAAQTPEERTLILRQHFPRTNRSCAYPSICSYAAIGQTFGPCYSPNIAADPQGSGAYVARTPHHAPEIEQLVQISTGK